MSRHHLVTGATGFVGGAIVLQLLTDPDVTVTAIVRGRPGITATQRLHDALGDMARGYDRIDLLPAIADRVVAVQGDVTAARCGVEPHDLGRVHEVWHCAASLQYLEEHREAIERHNVGGTSNVLDLIDVLDVPVVNHVSTAYVAGASTGRVTEGAVRTLDTVNNAYECSKIRGEWLMAERAGGRRLRILRPSIVIGHSTTRYGVNYSGIYGFARTLLAFRHRSAARLGTFLSHARLRLLADPSTPVNVIPVDIVARNAVAISRSTSSERYFHLVNSMSVPIGPGIVGLMELLGFREPLWVGESGGFTAVDRMLNAGMDFYGAYLLNGKTFDTRNTESAVGAGSCHFTIDDALLVDFLRCYLRTLPHYDSVIHLPDRVVHAHT